MSNDDLCNEDILTKLHRLARVLDDEIDPYQAMERGVDALLAMFDADCGWLLYPFDEESSYCHVRYGIARQGLGSTFADQDLLPLTPAVSAFFRDLIRQKKPRATTGADLDRALAGLAGRFPFRSQLAMAMAMKNESTWIVGLHQYSRARIWTPSEISLFHYCVDRLRETFDARSLQGTIKTVIAKRQKVDAELIWSEQRFRSLFHISSISLFIGDFSILIKKLGVLRTAGVSDIEAYLDERPEAFAELFNSLKVYEVNQAALDLFEACNKQDLLNAALKVITVKSIEAVINIFRNVMRQQRSFSFEASFKTLKNKKIHTILSVDSLPGIQSELVLISITDITDRKRAEKSLLESREKYRLLVETANDAIFIIDAESGYIMEANRMAGELLGKPVAEIIGLHKTELHSPEDWDRYREVFDIDPESGRHVASRETWVLHSDGRKIPVEISASVTNVSGQDIIVGIFHDISGRVMLDERRRLLATAVEKTDELVVITDPQGNIKYVNPAFERVTGYPFDEVQGKNPRLLSSGELEKSYYKVMWQTISNGEVWRGKFINRKKNGKLYQEDATITPVLDFQGRIQHYVAVKRDVTRQVALEDHVRQSQKMQAIGTLAGGIAHDFNNILTPIMGFAELSMGRGLSDEILQGNLIEIVRAAERAARLIDQILTFSKQTEKATQSLEIRSVISEVLKLLRASLPANIELICDIETNAMVKVDPTQLHQIVMNLCTNAYQAIDEHGWIRISIKSILVGKRQGVELGNLSHGKYVRIRVEDNGKGIAPEFLGRIFEPYFTLREGNLGGHGLGLSVVHGIVNDYRGTVTVHSEPGKGTRFDVYLPESAAILKTVKQRPRKSAPGNLGHILVVDYEQRLEDLEIRFLEQLGFKTSIYNSAQEALRDFAKKPKSYDLVITDMAMPTLTGMQLFDKLKKINQNIPVLLCSGHNKFMSGENSGEPGFDGFLQKPFTLDQLFAEVNRILRIH